MDGFLLNRHSMASDEICLITDDALTCDPCLQYKINVKAEGYCSDCRHHLCSACFEIHLKPIPTRNHKLLNTREMPITKTLKDECTDKCSIHMDKTIKYYCENHKQVGCSVCIILVHRTCDVGYIPTLAEKLFDSLEYQEFNKRLESICKKQQALQSEAGKTLVRTDKEAEDNLNEIGKFRMEIDKYFDGIEREIKEYVMRTKMEKRKEIEEVINKCDAVGEQLNLVKIEINEKRRNSQKCRLFIDLNRLQESIEKSECGLLGLEQGKSVKYRKFKPSKLLENIIHQKSEKLGSLDYDATEIAYTLEEEFTLDTNTVSSRRNMITELGDMKVYDDECDREKLETMDCFATYSQEVSIYNEMSNFEICIEENDDIADWYKEESKEESEQPGLEFNFEREVQHLGNISTKKEKQIAKIKANKVKLKTKRN